MVNNFYILILLLTDTLTVIVLVLEYTNTIVD